MAFEQDARVVVVDDDPFFVEAMLVHLPQLGLTPVACALDGAEAIAVVREHCPDVVARAWRGSMRRSQQRGPS